MIHLTVHHIKKHLESLGYKPESHEESHQLSFIRPVAKLQVPVFVRVLGEGQLLQLIAFVPMQVKDESLNGLARLLHLVNKEIDFPGFCLDEMSKTVFYRVIATCPDKKCDPTLFNSLLHAIDNSMEGFASPILAIGSGAAKFDEALKLAKEKGAERNSQMKK
jgi:hypothetical protein